MNLIVLASSLLVLHMDFNSVQMRKEVVVRHLREAASCGYNAVLWEVEDKIRWETCPECVRPEAFSKAEFREILAEADRLGLEPIPLLQTFGHAEYVLEQERYRCLRESPENPVLYCVSKPEVRDFLARFLNEYLDLFGRKVRYFHLGGDEARGFGTCAVCSKRDPVDLYVEHLQAMASVLRSKGVRPCIWCDMMLTGSSDPSQIRARVKRFPNDVVAWYWDYYYGHTGSNASLWANRLDYLTDVGLDVILAPAAASCGDSPFLPLYRRHSANVAAMADLARTRKLAGLCVTSWSVHLSPKCLQYPLWDLAARRFRSPGRSVEEDFSSVVRTRLGDMNPTTLFALTDWDSSLAQFDSRFGTLCAKWARPKPAGTAEALVAAARKDSADGLPKAEKVGKMLQDVSSALAEIESRPRTKGLDVFIDGARLVIEQGRAVLSVVEGEKAAPLDDKRLVAFYEREQMPQSATNCAALVRSPLLSE